MWVVEPLPDFEQLSPADQAWLIALAVEENNGLREYVRALRLLAEQLDQLGWWLQADIARAGSGGFAPNVESRPGAHR